MARKKIADSNSPLRSAVLRGESAASDLASPQELADFVSVRLAALADPARAIPMAAYMRTTQPFYGVAKPQVLAVEREVRRLFPCPDQRTYEQNVLALWRLPHREEKYLAIGYARQPRFLIPASVPLFERMIREGAWWDLVDETASYLVGGAVASDRRKMEPQMERWLLDTDLWIRRSALLCHLRHKQATNQEMLFRACLALAGEKEFFIRKAIGWALRELSKSAPDAVAGFLVANRDRLSGLSLREGAKHLVRMGALGKDWPRGFEESATAKR
jgi:3-methyladenine DNA glycosylase AlkD